MTSQDMPEFEELGIPAIRLLQGVLYDEDSSAWELLLANESDLTTYFAKIGLVVVIDRGEGVAYLQQWNDDQRTDGYERLPRLFRRQPLSYPATLLCVLLRDAYRQFEDEDIDNERCVVEVDTLAESWALFFPNDSDEIKLRRQVLSNLSALEKLKFVKKFGPGGNSWEVRKLLKARLPLEELETLRDRMLQEVNDE